MHRPGRQTDTTFLRLLADEFRNIQSTAKPRRPLRREGRRLPDAGAPSRAGAAACDDQVELDHRVDHARLVVGAAHARVDDELRVQLVAEDRPQEVELPAVDRAVEDPFEARRDVDTPPRVELDPPRSSSSSLRAASTSARHTPHRALVDVGDHLRRRRQPLLERSLRRAAVPPAARRTAPPRRRRPPRRRSRRAAGPSSSRSRCRSSRPRRRPRRRSRRASCPAQPVLAEQLDRGGEHSRPGLGGLRERRVEL